MGISESEEERCGRYRRFMEIDDAFRQSDLTALKAAVPDPGSFPNGIMPLGIGNCLEYAIYHSTLAFIRLLLEAGANPNPEDHTGFPPLIAAISCTRAVPGHEGRSDVPEIVELLLSFGADPNQRGINDYTALHMAAVEQNLAAVKILLDAGADPGLRTRIDDCETPREIAMKVSDPQIEELLAAYE